MNVRVHPTAVVDEGAQIGDGSAVWHFCHVSSSSRIGKNCTLGQNVFVAANVVVGDGVKIQNNVSLYEGVILEDFVFCGPSMVFTNVQTPRSEFPRNTSSDYIETRVGRGASIGANATIICGHSVGECALIGAGAVITKDVKPFALMVGNPARQMGWVCRCGIRLPLENPQKCVACDRSYVLDGDDLIEQKNS